MEGLPQPSTVHVYGIAQVMPLCKGSNPMLFDFLHLFLSVRIVNTIQTHELPFLTIHPSIPLKAQNLSFLTLHPSIPFIIFLQHLLKDRWGI